MYLELPDGAAPDGLNSLDALLGKAEGKRYLIQETGHHLALCDGAWKLIRFSNRNAKSKGQAKVNYALYHLSEDIGEQHDILTPHPERADAMTALLDPIYAGQPASEAFTNY